MQEPVIQIEDIGNFLSFLTVNENERETKVLEVVAEIEPLVKQIRLMQSVSPKNSSLIMQKGLNFEELMRLLVQGDVLNKF